ncbi:hypothetical protein CCP3SC5AM1_490019 [Gammaproteobacteria bacterium]
MDFITIRRRDSLVKKAILVNVPHQLAGQFSMKTGNIPPNLQVGTMIHIPYYRQNASCHHCLRDTPCFSHGVIYIWFSLYLIDDCTNDSLVLLLDR